MMLMQAARLLSIPDKIDDRVMELLEDHATDFLRSGGNLTLKDWSELSDIERNAFLRASEKSLAERAFAVGLANQGQLGAAQVFAALDGGALLARTMLNQELDSTIAKYHG